MSQSGVWSVGVTSLPAISGSVAVTNLPATQAVSGTVGVSNFPATQAVSGSVSAPACAPVTGTLASVSDSVSIFCPDASGFVVAVTPTSGNPLVGTLQALDAVRGTPRALFKGGVGELDTSTVTYTGTTTTLQEYRGVGFDNFKLSLIAVTSGSATVTLYASHVTSGTFLNNPVHLSDEAALRAGRAYVASTGNIAVTAGNYLNFVLANPAGSGKNVFVNLRKYVQSSGNVLTYQTRTNPTLISGGAVVTPANRRNDSTTASVASFTYATAGQNLSTGTAAATGMIPANGIDETITTMRMLAPGSSIGMSIGGAGGGLAATANISVDVAWYEEGIN